MHLPKYDTVASPTISLEGFFTTLLIGAYEGRQNISFDVPGAFLQAEMPDNKLVLLSFKGRSAVGKIDGVPSVSLLLSLLCHTSQIPR